MTLEEAKKLLEKLQKDDENFSFHLELTNGNSTYFDSTSKKFRKEAEAIEMVLKALDNSISKDILNEYLVEAQERYDVYKNAVKENEDLRNGVHRYLGQVELLKRILGIPINYVTLDKE